MLLRGSCCARRRANLNVSTKNGYLGGQNKPIVRVKATRGDITILLFEIVWVYHWFAREDLGLDVLQNRERRKYSARRGEKETRTMEPRDRG
jgi:hypothetical protein